MCQKHQMGWSRKWGTMLGDLCSLVRAEPPPPGLPPGHRGVSLYPECGPSSRERQDRRVEVFSAPGVENTFETAEWQGVLGWKPKE